MALENSPNIDTTRSLLFAPAYGAVISASILLLGFVLDLKSVNDLLVGIGILGKRVGKVPPPGIGNGAILWFRVVRLLGCLGLLVLSIFPVFGESGAAFPGVLAQELIASIPYLYASGLAFFSVNSKNTRQQLIRHVNCILFLAFCVYVYRDIVPLATFTGFPADRSECPRLWGKIALLFVTAVIIPLFTPRQYVPVDPLNPMKVPNPEQTASIFSFAFYFFLDHIIFLAYRQSKVEEDQLYPLCDTDASVHLKNRSFKYLDRFSGNKSRRHIFFGLMRVFRVEYTILAALIAVRGIATFSGPFAMQQLLQFIEMQAGETHEGVRPWVWIIVIFLGPVVGSLGFQLYIYINTRSLVRTEAIITQLVFAHSLRIRMKAEMETRDADDLQVVEALPSATGDQSGSEGTVTPGNGETSSGSEDSSVTVQASTSSLKSTISKQPSKPKEAKKSEGSLVGKINNLVTVDLDNIVEGRDFLMLVISIPAQLAVGMWFLYTVLGWSVWVGVASIILLVPVPGYSSSLFCGETGPVSVNVLRIVYRNNDGHLCDLTLIMGQPLNASKVFSSMTITYRLNATITSKVSLDRVDQFLKKTELLDSFDEERATLSTADPATDERIGFCNATFSWSNESDGSLTPSRRQFRLKIDGELLFRRGRVNLVVGPTGSGEMHWIPSSPESWYNLPRGSGVAYAAQESWVLNETIRTNIVFDTPFDEERYKKVLYQCALEPDLRLFEAGDRTEVGEKGLTLSGGQKARLTLARAVYSKAGILLLDDVLAALEKVAIVHTAQWIVEKCLDGDLMENRTIILVTHNVALARPIADFVVSFGPNGKSSRSAAPWQHSFRRMDKTQEENEAENVVTKAPDGKLILAEEIQMGHVGASALKLYLSAMGGQYPFFFFAFLFGGLILQHAGAVLKTWMLGYWAKQYDQHPAGECCLPYSVLAIVFSSVVILAATFIYLVFGQLRASKVIHSNLISSVLSAPLRWLDTTPTSRILARMKFGAVVIYTPIFFFPGAVVGILGAWIGQIYIAGQLPVKRLMSNTRAPVLAQYVLQVSSLVSIRAYGAQGSVSAESLSRIDRYTRAARNYYNLNRWVSVRVDILGATFSAALAAYLVYVKHSSAGDTGFLINMAVRTANRFEVEALTFLSLERIQGYIEIEHEKAATEAGKPPAYWPASGDLRVEHLSASGYSENGPKVLHDISFNVKAGERVGIVGRTGSGKSSLTLSLLRCIPTEGSMTYDGLETLTVNLDALRSRITIIPQVPELLSGSLRANLDPFGQYDDIELNYALRAAGLFALQNETDEGRITLDSAVSAGGSNLSIGQRQIFALARAIVRKSKILILDEDYTTDSIIQNSLRHELRGDVSLIIVAHRLQTVMDADKILVLDAGRIVEFDSPKELLKIKDGKLRALVEESGDRDALYSMAGAAH
ncbi:hypothetical protein DFH08DRAFT_910875 [Mycena albidolilacea]|uniref:ATP-binding cassette transporter n=1 Tax=Mycena albidolilacea TaxID=1033008 RepID=A0AAD7AN29_9AGAR|nr:hypothetical protein DFH08DRAFT_910875 [Mycena albidolilacea]